jgi:hypothetical protein
METKRKWPRYALSVVVGIVAVAVTVVIVHRETAGIPARCSPITSAVPLRPAPLSRRSPVIYFNGGTTGDDYRIGRLPEGRIPPASVRLVIGPTHAGWSADVVKDPYVVERGGRLFLFYSGYSNSSNEWSVGLAISADRGHEWHRLPRPLFPPFRTDGVHPFPVVVPPADGQPRWTLLFARTGGIYAATSRDGLAWRVSPTPVIRSPSPGVDLDPGDVRRVGSRWLLLYGIGGKTAPWHMARAWASRLDGPYGNSAPVTQAGAYSARLQLAASAPAGAKTVQVTEPTRVGPFLGVLDDQHGWQLVHVLGASNRRARLAERLAGGFNRGAELYAVTRTSVDPKSVILTRTSHLLLATGFQAIPGCLLEVSLVGRFLNDSFTRVAWDWNAAPLVPLGKHEGWRTNSAENPVVQR